MTSVVVSCPDCRTVLTEINLEGRWGEGTTRAADFACSGCGAVVTVISRRRQPPTREEPDPIINYKRPSNA